MPSLLSWEMAYLSARNTDVPDFPAGPDSYHKPSSDSARDSCGDSEGLGGGRFRVYATLSLDLLLFDKRLPK